MLYVPASIFFFFLIFSFFLETLKEIDDVYEKNIRKKMIWTRKNASSSSISRGH